MYLLTHTHTHTHTHAGAAYVHVPPQHEEALVAWLSDVRSFLLASGGSGGARFAARYAKASAAQSSGLTGAGAADRARLDQQV